MDLDAGLDNGGAAAQLARAWRQSRHRRVLFSSDDRDCAQALVSRMFRAHRLDPRCPRAPLAARMEVLGAGLTSLSSLAYGSAVDIVPGPLERFYLLQLPLAGAARVRCGEQSLDATPHQATLLSPAPDLAMHWAAGNEQLILRIEAEAMQRFVGAWCGDAQLPAPTFAPAVALDAQPALLDTLLLLIDVADRANALPSPGEGASAGHPHALPLVNLHYRLMATLLTQVPHDLHDRLGDRCPPVTPRSVRQVEEFMVAHCGEPLTPEGLAHVAGVSLRSLFLGFQRYRGVSPMRLLREMRLHRAHEALLQAERGTRVTDVALRWGFSHLGRFGGDYTRVFGETPRQTLAARGRA